MTAAGVALAQDASARWEHFRHEADIGVRGIGPTKASAFEQAALALTAVVTDPAGIAPREDVAIACEAPDDELLLAEWLNAVIYEMVTRGMVFGRYAVSIEDHRLTATACGEPVDAKRHGPAVEPKGATYTSLRVGCESNAWVAQTVVDV